MAPTSAGGLAHLLTEAHYSCNQEQSTTAAYPVAGGRPRGPELADPSVGSTSVEVEVMAIMKAQPSPRDKFNCPRPPSRCLNTHQGRGRYWSHQDRW